MQEYVVGLLYRYPSTVMLKKKLIKSYINQSILFKTLKCNSYPNIAFLTFQDNMIKKSWCIFTFFISYCEQVKRGKICLLDKDR